MTSSPAAGTPTGEGGKYRTIVADPPWDQPSGGPASGIAGMSSPAVVYAQRRAVASLAEQGGQGT